ncbi:hypothetical protein MPER_05298 [Moniliophthora perniciosa FA553]|nr:hypothetical protein MPER_05298 [Moniliophthora perniciosa FA553]
MENFVNSSGTTPDSTYEKFRASYQRHHPDKTLLSFNQIKRMVARLTGIIMLTRDMCVNSCAAFTGPWKGLKQCPECGDERFEEDGITPRKVFWVFLLGPQLQAQFLRNDGSLDYRIKATEKLLSMATGTTIELQKRTDYIHGEAYMTAVAAGKITNQSVLVMWSGDGAQLYRDKDSDIWISIFSLLEFPPHLRYKVKHILPDTVVPGPKAPKNHISFLFHTMYHLSALMREGIRLWKRELEVFSLRKLFLAFACMDAVAMASVSGWVGHHGKHGCRFMCGMPGRHKPRSPHYYPVMKLPEGYKQSGCDHPDVSRHNLTKGSPTRYSTCLHLCFVVYSDSYEGPEGTGSQASYSGRHC